MRVDQLQFGAFGPWLDVTVRCTSPYVNLGSQQFRPEVKRDGRVENTVNWDQHFQPEKLKKKLVGLKT